jgi:hypothetical protein
MIPIFMSISDIYLILFKKVIQRRVPCCHFTVLARLHLMRPHHMCTLHVARKPVAHTYSCTRYERLVLSSYLRLYSGIACTKFIQLSDWRQQAQYASTLTFTCW